MRKIKILSSGPIRTMGMIHGPIITPWKVDDTKLASLVSEGLNVVEVLPDGSERKVTRDSIMHANQTTAKPIDATKPKVATPVDEPVVVSVDENNEEAVEATTDSDEVVEDVAPVVEEKAPTEHRPQNNYYNKKHNKNRK